MSRGIKRVEVPRPVPPEMWGKDHFSTFGYIECRIVDNDGIPDREHMRVDPELHPGLGNRACRISDHKFPTRLRDGVELVDHDDWTCAEDLEAAGLIKWEGTGMHPIFVMTDKGKAVAGRLRAHKGAGGNFGDFDPGTI